MLIHTFDNLVEEWEKDCKIDETEISQSTAKTPQLHAKYAGIRSRSKLKLARAEAEYKRMSGIKRAYYRGELDEETLKEHGWSQWVKNKVVNTSMHDVLSSDPDLIEMSLNMALHQEVVDFCEYILKELNQRTWQLRIILDTERYFGGKEWPTN